MTTITTIMIMDTTTRDTTIASARNVQGRMRRQIPHHHPAPLRAQALDAMEILGAGNETRTRDLNLGKVALYQLSYSRPKQRRNCRAVPAGVKDNEAAAGGFRAH